MTAEELEALKKAKVTAAEGFDQRLKAHQDLQRITKEQPPLAGAGGRKMDASTLKAMQNNRSRQPLQRDISVSILKQTKNIKLS